MIRRYLTPVVLSLLLLGCTDVGGDSVQNDRPPWQGEVSVYGALRAMFHDGQIGEMVALDTILPNPNLYALGALADLSGEITVVAGKAYLSYALDDDSVRTDVNSQPSAGAALLVASDVPAWQSFTIERSIRYEDLEGVLAELAVEAGMNVEERFPFLLRGEFEDLQWHVIEGTRLASGGSSHQNHLEAATRMERDRAIATLVGFFSQNDQGVFTHMGSTTHIHCVLHDPLSTGHVDHVTIPKGATVEFPLIDSSPTSSREE